MTDDAVVIMIILLLLGLAFFLSLMEYSRGYSNGFHDGEKA